MSAARLDRPPIGGEVFTMGPLFDVCAVHGPDRVVVSKTAMTRATAQRVADRMNLLVIESGLTLRFEATPFSERKEAEGGI